MLSYGITKAEAGVFNPVDGSVSAWTEMEVYKNTILMPEEDPTRTSHYKQGQASPVLVQEVAGVITVTFSLLDISAANKADWIGGTVTTVNTKDTWNSPRVKTSKTKALRFTMEDGSIMTIVKASCWTKLDVKASDTEINLLLVTATVLDPGFPEVLPISWEDA